MIVWLSGQPGSGKTALSRLIFKSYVGLDGDIVRKLTFNKDYSKKGRLKNIRLTYLIARILSFFKFKVVVSLVSPYCKYRDKVASKGFLFILSSNRNLRKEFHVLNFEIPKVKFTLIDTDELIETSVSKIKDKINK